VWPITGGIARRCPLADHREFQPPDPDPEPGSWLTDTDVGLIKAPSPPLAFAPRWERIAVAAAVIFQVFILVAMLLGRTVPFVGAQTVLLQVEPVDPRDLLRGDYVTLSYGINRPPAGKYEDGRPMYVTLVPESDGRRYRAGEFLSEPPASGVFIRGTVQSQGRATFGIESYYVQEGTGHDYERAVRDRRLWAEVALDRNGNAALRRLLVQ
jgi:uncharacterized membrane-anchored protein